MAAFATPAELAGFLQQDLDTYSATQALDITSRAIRDYCGWNITEETVTGKVLDPNGGRSIWLPTLLLTAVASVVEDGVTLTVVTGYDWTSFGQLMRIGRYWTSRPRSVTVTYTHGYTAAPDSVKGVCLAAAGRRYQNPEMARSYTVGGVSESYATPTTESMGLLFGDEKDELEPYQIKAVG